MRRIENFPLKSASLLLACFVWMYVRSEDKPLQVLSLPLQFEGLPAELALAGDVPDSVAVRVRAPEMTLRNLSPGRFHARVDLSDVQAGAIDVPLTNDIVRGPLGVEVIRVDPPSIALKVERRVRREVPVVARIKGRPAPGFEYDGYTLTPDKVVVEGMQKVKNGAEVKATTIEAGAPAAEAAQPAGAAPAETATAPAKEN